MISGIRNPVDYMISFYMNVNDIDEGELNTSVEEI